MKKFISIFIFLLSITAPLSAMDPSSLPLSEVRPQEVSSYAGQDHERKQAQAQLDAQQFARERETKRTLANQQSSNCEESAGEAMITEAFSKIDKDTIHIKLHRNLQKHVGSFLPGGTFLAIGKKHPFYYPKELMPAIMLCTGEPIFSSSNKGLYVEDIKQRPALHSSTYNLLENNEQELRDFYAKK